MNQAQSQILRNFPHLPPSHLPIGMEAIYSYLLRVYPSQRNPTQVSSSRKYWLGGADPLDYVNVYSNLGDRSQRIPPHWHYVSMGLSDLYGDGRVHHCPGPNQPSGFGFELTFRLKRESIDDPRPPLWPAAMMQHLAKYVFGGAKLSTGDFVKWGTSLDGVSESRIEHILLTNDPQLAQFLTPCGMVGFIQIVGICKEERKAIQRWKVVGVQELLRKYPATGGSWLITDLRRGESVFDVDPGSKEIVDLGVAAEGSNLSGIQSWCWWTEWTDYGNELGLPANSQYGSYDRAQSSSILGHTSGIHQPDPSGHQELSGYQASSSVDNYHNTTSARIYSPDNVVPLRAVHVGLNAEAATFLYHWHWKDDWLMEGISLSKVTRTGTATLRSCHRELLAVSRKWTNRSPAVVVGSISRYAVNYRNVCSRTSESSNRLMMLQAHFKNLERFSGLSAI